MTSINNYGSVGANHQSSRILGEDIQPDNDNIDTKKTGLKKVHPDLVVAQDVKRQAMEVKPPLGGSDLVLNPVNLHKVTHDISKIAPESLAVFMKLIALLTQLNKDYQDTNTKMMALSVLSAKAAAENIRQSGEDARIAAIGQSTLSITMSVAGAVSQIAGHAGEARVKMNAPGAKTLGLAGGKSVATATMAVETEISGTTSNLVRSETNQVSRSRIVTTERASVTEVTSGATTVINNSAASVAGNVQATPQIRATPNAAHEITHSMETVSPPATDDIAKAAKEAKKAQKQAKLAKEEYYAKDSVIKTLRSSEHWKSSGMILSQLSQPLGQIVRASLDYQATAERAQEKLNDSNARVANETSGQAKESADSARHLMDSMRSAMQNIIQSIDGAMSSAASNIRV